MLQNFVSLLSGFQVALAPENIGACLLGAVLGLVVGAMPGIGSLAGCALLLPLTYKFNPTTAIIMLGALYYSNMYGGSFSAILLNIPGDSPAITTALDGYPMAKKGRPGQALMAANRYPDPDHHCLRPGLSGPEVRLRGNDADPADRHDLYQLAHR